MAVALAKGGAAKPTPMAISSEMQRTLSGLARAMAPSQRYVRGIFSGGTFCFEAQLIHAAAGIKRILQHTDGRQRPAAEQRARATENTIIDMGDDEFTQGRPHPMIDPSLRDARIRDEVADPTTAVVLFDVVLGYGSPLTRRPVCSASSAPPGPRRRPPAARSRSSATSAGPTATRRIAARSWPVSKPPACWWLPSNAEAATWSAAIIAERQGALS